MNLQAGLGEREVKSYQTIHASNDTAIGWPFNEGHCVSYDTGLPFYRQYYHLRDTIEQGRMQKKERQGISHDSGRDPKEETRTREDIHEGTRKYSGSSDACNCATNDQSNRRRCCTTYNWNHVQYTFRTCQSGTTIFT